MCEFLTANQLHKIIIIITLMFQDVIFYHIFTRKCHDLSIKKHFFTQHELIRVFRFFGWE